MNDINEDGSTGSYRPAPLVSREGDVSEVNVTLAIISERLKAESTRANAAEHRALDYLHHLHTATEELKLYKLKLKEAKNQISRAQDTIDQVVAQRNEANAEVARARSLVRRLQEEKLVMLAREEGLRVGYREGPSVGHRMSYDHEHYYDDVYFDRTRSGGHTFRSSTRKEHIREQGHRRPDGTEAEPTAQRQRADSVIVTPNRPSVIRRDTDEVPRPKMEPGAHVPLVPPAWSTAHVRSSLGPHLRFYQRPPSQSSTSSAPEINAIPESPCETSPSFSQSSELSSLYATNRPLPQDDQDQDQDQDQESYQPQPLSGLRLHSTLSLTHDRPGSTWPADFMPFLSSPAPTPVPENPPGTNSNATTFLNGAGLHEGHGQPRFHAHEDAPHSPATGYPARPTHAHTSHKRSKGEDNGRDKNRKRDRRNRGRDHSRDRHWDRDKIETGTGIEMGVESGNGNGNGMGFATELMRIGGTTLGHNASANMNGTGIGLAADLEQSTKSKGGELLARSPAPLMRPISLFDSDEDG